MRGLLALCALGGCQLIWPIEQPPPPNRPFGCSPASLLTDDFNGMDVLGRPWSVSGFGSPLAATEVGSGLRLEIGGGHLIATAEPFLELRDQEFSIGLELDEGSQLGGDRITFDLRTEDGLHRLSYGLVSDPTVPGMPLRLVAEYDTFSPDGSIASTTSIGSSDHAGNQVPVSLVIRHQGDVTTFLEGTPPAVKFTTDLTPLEWIGYMRPSIRATSQTGTLRYFVRSFNGGGAPTGEACPASTIEELFDGTISNEWQVVTPNGDCTVAVDAGGSLQMAFSAPDAVHQCILHTSTYYDLRGHRVEIEIEEVFPADSTFVNFRFEVESRTAVARLELDVPMSIIKATFGTTGGETEVGRTTAANLAGSTWRITGTPDDRLLFEIRTDGGFQAVGATQPGAVGPLDVVRLRIMASGSGIGAGAVTRLGAIRSGAAL